MPDPRSTFLERWGASLGKGRLAFVDELKGLAILLIMVFHTELALGWAPRSQGFVGVDIFLLLSGWTIARSVKPKERASTFFGKRFLRIFPTYWIVLVLFGIVKPAILEGSVDFLSLLIHVVALQAFTAPIHFFAINPSFWFMSLLLVVYPVAYLFRRDTNPYFWLCLGIGLALVTHALAAAWGHQTLGIYLPPRIVSFCAGFAIAVSLKNSAAPRSGAVLCGLTVMGGLYLETRGVAMLLPTLFACSICWAYGLLRGGIGAPSATIARKVAPLAALGAISYEVFLLHQPLLRLSLKLFDVPETTPNRMASALTGILLSIAAGWFLHQLVEVRRRAPKSVPSPLTATSQL